MKPSNSRKKSPGPRPISEAGHTPGKRPRVDVPRFSRWLKVSRLRARIRGEQVTQAQLAHSLGWPVRRIQKMEQGDLWPQVEWIEPLADFFAYDRDKAYAMVFELPPDLHYFLVATKEGQRVVENIRKLMADVPNPTRLADLPIDFKTYRTDNKSMRRRQRMLSEMDARTQEEQLYQGESG